MNQVGPWPIVHLSMFLLRCFSGVALIYYQGWTQVRYGWSYIWKGDSWPLLIHFQQTGDGYSTPVALLFAILIAVFFFFSPLLYTIGFLTRFNAASIFVGIVVALNLGIHNYLFNQVSLEAAAKVQAVQEVIVLYFLISLFFMLNGGGMLAADRLFDRRRGRNKTAGGLYAG